MQMGVILQDNTLQKVTIIGSGLMGHGIALKFAQYGFSVNVYDPNKNSLNNFISMGFDERCSLSLKLKFIPMEFFQFSPYFGGLKNSNLPPSGSVSLAKTFPSTICER